MKKTKIIVHLEMYVDKELSNKKLSKLNSYLTQGGDLLKNLIVSKTKGKARGGVSVKMGYVDSKEPENSYDKPKKESVIGAIVDGLKRAGIEVEPIKLSDILSKKEGEDKEDCDCPSCKLRRMFAKHFGSSPSGEFLKELDKAITDAAQIAKTMANFDHTKVPKDPERIAQAIKDIETDLAVFKKTSEMLEKLPAEYKKEDTKYLTDKELLGKGIELANMLITELKNMQPKADEKPPEATN